MKTKTTFKTNQNAWGNFKKEQRTQSGAFCQLKNALSNPKFGFTFTAKDLDAFRASKSDAEWKEVGITKSGNFSAYYILISLMRWYKESTEKEIRTAKEKAVNKKKTAKKDR